MFGMQRSKTSADRKRKQRPYCYSLNVFMVSIDWTNFEEKKTFKINYYIHNNVILISTYRYCSDLLKEI